MTACSFAVSAHVCWNWAARAAPTALPLFTLGRTLSTCRSLDMKRLGSIRRACSACMGPPGLGFSKRSTGNVASWRLRAYDCVMTAKKRKTKRRKLPSLPGKLGRVWASIQEELLSLAEEETGAEARWNRPRKRRISLRVDAEVVDWFKSKGPGYQTRINRILRKVMVEGKKRRG